MSLLNPVHGSASYCIASRIGPFINQHKSPTTNTAPRRLLNSPSPSPTPHLLYTSLASLHAQHRPTHNPPTSYHYTSPHKQTLTHSHPYPLHLPSPITLHPTPPTPHPSPLSLPTPLPITSPLPLPLPLPLPITLPLPLTSMPHASITHTHTLSTTHLPPPTTLLRKPKLSPSHQLVNTSTTS